MNCRDIKLLFDDYLTENINANQQEAFDNHLNNCRKCTESLNLYKEALEIIKEDKNKKFDDNLFSEIKTGLYLEIKTDRKISIYKIIYSVAASFLLLVSAYTGYLVGKAFSGKYQSALSEVNIEDEIFNDDLDFNLFDE